MVPSGSCRCKCELSVAVNPISAGYWRGIRVPRTARLAQSQSWGSLDRTSFNSIWRRVSTQVSVAASEVPRSSASVTHTKSAALCRPAIQRTTTQSPCHKVRAMMPKTSPQSRAKFSKLLKETTSYSCTGRPERMRVPPDCVRNIVVGLSTGLR